MSEATNRALLLLDFANTEQLVKEIPETLKRVQRFQTTFQVDPCGIDELFHYCTEFLDVAVRGPESEIAWSERPAFVKDVLRALKLCRKFSRCDGHLYALHVKISDLCVSTLQYLDQQAQQRA